MIVVAMASFPPRKVGMLNVVDKMLPQCDKMYLYLNGYAERPAELPDNPKLNVILAGGNSEYKDLGSQGKMFWLGKDPDSYYLTVDDDIHYPSDYVSFLVRGVDKYDRKAVVGLHGGLYRVAVNGAFPPNGMVKDHRTLFGYDKAYPKDQSVHILGAGVMAMYPSAIGASFEACCTGPLHSGDDEDIAIFSQKNNIPMIRIASRGGWVKPNSSQWTIDPLHRRMAYLRAADAKIRAWKKWHIVPIPRPVPPQPMQSTGPSFDKILLSDTDRDFCNKILSSDGLAALLIDRIKRKVPTSLIRMSDGERAIIDFSQTGRLTGFLQDVGWLRKYGLEGADLRKVGADLLWAGNNADYLACTISGVFWDCFRVHDYFPDRAQFVDQFWPQLMAATDRVGALLRAGRVLVLHRDHVQITQALKHRYEGIDISGVSLDSWKDHDRLLKTLPAHSAQLVIGSGGASGKPFFVKLAQASGKVVLDVGEALGKAWV